MNVTSSVMWMVKYASIAMVASWGIIVLNMFILAFSREICRRISEATEKQWLEAKFSWLSQMYSNAAFKYERRISPILKRHPLQMAIERWIM